MTTTRAHAPGAIGWAKGDATGPHRFEDPHPTARVAIQAKPTLAIWGEQDRTLHAKHFVPLFKEHFLSAPFHLLPD